MADPEELVPLACLLVSRLSSFTTGAIFVVDGGESRSSCEVEMIIDAHTTSGPTGSPRLRSAATPSVSKHAGQRHGLRAGLGDGSCRRRGLRAVSGIANEARHVDEGQPGSSQALEDERHVGFGTVHVELSVEEATSRACAATACARVKITTPLFRNCSARRPASVGDLQALGG